MILQKTYLSGVLDKTDADKVRYDNCVKTLLADPQVLARILKYSVAEFAEEDIESIMACMEEAEVTIILPSEERYLHKVESVATEDVDASSGSIMYDIRFAVHTATGKAKILINVEVQQTTHLPYQLENRIVYYMARMISSQKNVEFTGQDYDGIKKVYSIWICMDAAATKDSIIETGLESRSIYGVPEHLPDMDLMRAVIINIRKDEAMETSENPLIAMLEELLSAKNARIKKRNLEEKHGIKMTVEMERSGYIMCNLSELVWEDGLEKGREQGLKQGLERGLEQGLEKGREQGLEQGFADNVRKLIQKLNMTVEQAMDLLEIPPEKRQGLLQRL